MKNSTLLHEHYSLLTAQSQVMYTFKTQKHYNYYIIWGKIIAYLLLSVIKLVKELVICWIVNNPTGPMPFSCKRRSPSKWTKLWLCYDSDALVRQERQFGLCSPTPVCSGRISCMQYGQSWPRSRIESQISHIWLIIYLAWINSCVTHFVFDSCVYGGAPKCWKKNLMSPDL